MIYFVDSKYLDNNDLSVSLYVSDYSSTVGSINVKYKKFIKPVADAFRGLAFTSAFVHFRDRKNFAADFLISLVAAKYTSGSIYFYCDTSEDYFFYKKMITNFEDLTSFELKNSLLFELKKEIKNKIKEFNEY